MEQGFQEFFEWFVFGNLITRLESQLHHTNLYMQSFQQKASEIAETTPGNRQDLITQAITGPCKEILALRGNDSGLLV